MLIQHIPPHLLPVCILFVPKTMRDQIKYRKIKKYTGGKENMLFDLTALETGMGNLHLNQVQGHIKV
jgi:hypothetical protein